MEMKLCRKENLDEVIAFVLNINGIRQHRCKPFTVDSTRKEIFSAYTSYLEREDYQVLLQYDNEELVTVMAVMVIEEDRYLQLVSGVYSKRDYPEACDSLVGYLEKRYSGYKYYVNLPEENREAVEYYGVNGFTLLDDAVMYEFTDFSGMRISEGVQEMDAENAEDIYAFIDRFTAEDTYWKPERLREHPEKFIILGYFDNGIKGAVMAQVYRDNSVEIMGLYGEGRSGLVTSLAWIAGLKGISRISWYIDDKSDVYLAESLDFTYYDSNLCCMKLLP